jgi:hypothetical protein
MIDKSPIGFELFGTADKNRMCVQRANTRGEVLAPQRKPNQREYGLITACCAPSVRKWVSSKVLPIDEHVKGNFKSRRLNDEWYNERG